MNHYEKQAKRLETILNLLDKAQLEMGKVIAAEAKADCPDDTDYLELKREILAAQQGADLLWGAVYALVE